MKKFSYSLKFNRYISTSVFLFFYDYYLIDEMIESFKFYVCATLIVLHF